MRDRATIGPRRSSDTLAETAAKRTDEKSGSEALRVMVVDNDMRAADSLELMLNAAGYPETCVAYSAQAALDLEARFCPDVAFLDMSLLDLDSNELAQRLRERAQLRHLRLIAMTDSRLHAGRDVARNAGFERYLLKPVATEDLSNLLAVQPEGGRTPQDQA